MRIYDIQRNKQLVLVFPIYQKHSLPWDLKSIFDCELDLDAVDLLQTGGYVQIGEVTLHLEEAA